MHSIPRRLTLLMVIALLLGACGGAAEQGDTGGEAETPTAPATAQTTEEAQTDPAASPTDAAAPQNEGDGTLTFGTILPETGSLAFLGPPEFAAAELAVQEINAAGGVLGNDVVLMQGDSGDTTTDIANQTVDRLLADDADVIVGAASSAVSFTVIDKITGAGVVQFSPANTSRDFTDYDDNGLYFRTAPSDVLQSRVLSEVIVEDGNATVSIMALQDPYGEGLADDTRTNLEESGVQVLDTIIYDPQAQTFDAEVQQLVSSDPDGIVVIGFDETARIITTLIEAGLGPDEKNLYGTDGNMGNALGEQFAGQEGALEGMRGTTPLTDLSDDFTERLLEVDPELVDFNYSGETYDAIVVSALAAEIAGSDAGTALASEIAGVTKDGTKCTTFSECRDLVQAGEDIDYDGIVGPIALDDNGDPTSASFAILEFQPDNSLEVVEFRRAEV